MAVWLIACVIHASAIKFLDRDLVADAQAEKAEVQKFFAEVVDQGTSMEKSLAAEKEKNKELETTAKHAVAELKKEKAAFAEELHKVEAKQEKKVKLLTTKNEGLAQELSREKLSVKLHQKTEDALRDRLSEIGKVFSTQEATVKNIIETSAEVETKLKAQDHVTESKVDESADDAKEQKAAAAATADDDDSKSAKDTKEETKADDAVTKDETKADDAKADDSKADDSVDTTVDSDSTDKAVEKAKATTVSLARGSGAATTAAPAKSEELDLEDKAQPTPAAASADADTDMDNISKEVDALSSDVDAQPESSSAMLNKAGDALSNLLK
jgi:hypothetical protein